MKIEGGGEPKAFPVLQRIDFTLECRNAFSVEVGQFFIIDIEIAFACLNRNLSICIFYRLNGRCDFLEAFWNFSVLIWL